MQALSDPKTSWSSMVCDEAESTSDLARAIVLTCPGPFPMYVRALVQTGGKGQGTRTWWSDEGSLAFTVGFDSQILGLSRVHEPMAALAAAVALIDVLQPLVPEHPLGIRWPNDVQCAGRKLAGILPERVETPYGPRLLIGVGLNVQTNFNSAPTDVAKLATSLELLNAPDLNPQTHDEIFTSFLVRILAALDALAAEDPALPARWSELDLLSGSAVNVNLGGQIITGKALGIDSGGGLIVATERQGRMMLHGGQVLR